jgi:hypothetical protein
VGYPTIAAIIPSAGRASLARTLDSIAPQKRPGDQVIVIGDTREGDLVETEALCARHPAGALYVPWTDGTMTHGHRQINHGMGLATADYLTFNDDDDIYVADAFDNIRDAAGMTPARPLLFRFRSYLGGQEFWLLPGLVRQGCIGGHCAVFPNDPARLGRWGDHYEGDFTFIADSLERWKPVEPVWCFDIIAIQRPQ